MGRITHVSRRCLISDARQAYPANVYPQDSTAVSLAHVTAGDIMTSPVITVLADASTQQVADTLTRHRISAAPVVRLTLAHPQGFDNVSCGVAISFALRCSLISVGKLIYGFNVSVDGYIADAQGNIDWTDPSEELHQYWNDFERETALSFYGRRLYELMSAYWPTADKAPDATPLIVDFAHIWRDMPKVVFSRTLESVDWNSRLERGDPVEVVTKLKAETDGRLEVAGATLAAPIVQAGLVDEYWIVVTPTAVGGGTPFFPTLPSWISLRLLENRTFPGGTVLLRYEAKHD